MKVYDQLYINGDWVSAHGSETHDVINPATEEVIARVVMGDTEDLNRAVTAAKAAFNTWSRTSAQERCDLIKRIATKMEERKADLIDAVSSSMGCPLQMTADLQINGPIYGMQSFAERAFRMEDAEEVGHSLIIKEPVGVCAFINPWNYPLHQFVGKVAPALAAGCTMVVKPAEQTPLQDLIMAEIFDEVGLPAGVFNLVIGSGAVVGAAMSSHKDVDMVSFTGSIRAGVKIAEGYSIGTDEAFMGPMSSAQQKKAVLDYIDKSIEEGASLVTGGTEMPVGHKQGFYVKPTIFADVNNQMSIAREEIFGPVLCMIPYNDLEEAIEIANDTAFGGFK